MKVVVNRESNIRDKRALEKSKADNATAKANIDYLAMMADIDIPAEGDNENDMVS